MEVSTQYLIADGFDIGTGRDPYRNFIYTSFQELATNVSHRRVASQAKKDGDTCYQKCAVLLPVTRPATLKHINTLLRKYLK
jgi:acyl-[acyl-carrier-protein] desaturase